MWKRYFFLDQMTFEVAYKLTPVRQSVRHSDVHHSVRHSVCPCDDFGLFKTALRIYPIFCMSVEDNRAHCLSQMFFLKKYQIIGDQVLCQTKVTVQNKCFLTFLSFSPQWL